MLWPPNIRESPSGLPMSLRLAYLTGQYPRATDTFIQREVATLRALGHHVQTFSVRQPPLTEEIAPQIASEKRSTIYLLPLRGIIRAHLFQFLTSPRKYVSALVLALKTCQADLHAIVRQVAYFAEAGQLTRLMNRYELAHIHNNFGDSSCSVAAIAATMGGFTFSFTLHGTTEFYEHKRWWIGEKIRRALFVNSVCNFCRSQAMLFSASDCWQKLAVVHCGIDPSTHETRTHKGTGSRLLFVGRLAAEKGLPILLEAVARLDGATLDLVGDGPERKILEARTQALDISGRVRFFGYQTQQQIREILRQTDVFVMSSFTEGVPVVLMEAMAAGVPVVATQVGGIPELVHDGHNGLLVAPGDANAAAAAIRRLLEDPDLRNRFGVAGREKVEREFNIQVECQKLAKIMSCMINGSVPPSAVPQECSLLPDGN